MFNSIAWAMGPGAQTGAQGGPQSMFASFLPLIIIFAIFYFLLIRPQQKKAKQHREMLGALKKGDKVVTSGGIYGLVELVSENTVVVKIAENTKIKIGKANIATIRSSADED
ncbi:preprotein translocase subunit YajC [bacterium BMS3Abin07]|nr:preprotein translocase subunit YajC [bacterium BMS3Abin07]GBE31234.1 preprotein translocase subunit YajC [bacterium BMS3Bbin05]HDL20035.1 preprotein translocase subunit YajC [Nitrospirota bacterium]HDO23511.1 preprotein translocase subunit YajC [Nitrospirota bacterium]HDZ87537.1 preprotein translocase subunit YajC [Nitrospirota bacterium]